MTDKDLEDMYKASSDESHVTALRLIYNLGYSAGSGTPLQANSTPPVASQPRPSDAVVSTTKTVTKRK